MRCLAKVLTAMLGTFGILMLLHAPFLPLPYFWDEAGYYIPAAMDFYRHGLLIPVSTAPVGHTPFVSVYLGLAWLLFGFSPLVARSAMILMAAAGLVATYLLGRSVARREVAIWACVLLAASPLYFAQSSLAHLDLAAALFTTLGILALVEERWAWFGLAESLAIMSKETAVILLPIAALHAWRKRRELHHLAWAWIAAPLAPLLLWTAYYHHRTGYWTGNGRYLAYNLFATLEPVHIFFGLLRRLYEVFIGGFNWLPVVAATAGVWWARQHPADKVAQADGTTPRPGIMPSSWLQRDFLLLAVWLTAAYGLFHSAVGGAILPRYLLPIFPAFYLALAVMIGRLPRAAALGMFALTAAAFVAGWFINPPYPFPYEDNLSYADFIRLHQKAARFLEQQPGQPRILTAWPATDELSRPFLGYVNHPLRVVSSQGFSARDFAGVPASSFDLLYLYSRKWDPKSNWTRMSPSFDGLIRQVFHYSPPVPEAELAATYHLKLLAAYRARGQWVKIYSK